MKRINPPEHVEAILRKFENVPRTEEAFYLRYLRLPLPDVETLASWYGEEDPWRLFKHIGAAWRVCRPPRGKTGRPAQNPRPKGPQVASSGGR